MSRRTPYTFFQNMVSSKPWFFGDYKTQQSSDFYSTDRGHVNTSFEKKEMQKMSCRTPQHFFSKYGLQKLRFFGDYKTQQSSDFYSTDRGHVNICFEMKIEKSKKESFFAQERGGVPLSQCKHWFMDGTFSVYVFFFSL